MVDSRIHCTQLKITTQPGPMEAATGAVKITVKCWLSRPRAVSYGTESDSGVALAAVRGVYGALSGGWPWAPLFSLKFPPRIQLACGCFSPGRAPIIGPFRV